MTAEPTLWGVELEDGTVTPCRVSETLYEGRHICWRAGGIVNGTTPRDAVVQWAARMGLPAESILAPGVPSRAELIAERDRGPRSVWLVTWRITQDGSPTHGVEGCFCDEQIATWVALCSINTNWVQGEWEDYSNILDEFKKLITEGAFVEALQLWTTASKSYYEVEVTQVDLEGGEAKYDLDLRAMGFDPE